MSFETMFKPKMVDENYATKKLKFFYFLITYCLLTLALSLSGKPSCEEKKNEIK